MFALTLWPHASESQSAFIKEFEEVCSRTSEADALSVENLVELIKRCDRLKAEVEKASEPERTVYLKRLNMCRALYNYVLESKKAAGNSDK